ncbi:MAG TPA: hypothetical protein VN721_17115 [Flavipsychrobacter sp.]|nr:hypothetical protein [Flavipsychrobacter sp.]
MPNAFGDTRIIGQNWLRLCPWVFIGFNIFKVLVKDYFHSSDETSILSDQTDISMDSSKLV